MKFLFFVTLITMLLLVQTSHDEEFDDKSFQSDWTPNMWLDYLLKIKCSRIVSIKSDSGKFLQMKKDKMYISDVESKKDSSFYLDKDQDDSYTVMGFRKLFSIKKSKLLNEKHGKRPTKTQFYSIIYNGKKLKVLEQTEAKLCSKAVEDKDKNGMTANCDIINDVAKNIIEESSSDFRILIASDMKTDAIRVLSLCNSGIPFDLHSVLDGYFTLQIQTTNDEGDSTAKLQANKIKTDSFDFVPLFRKNENENLDEFTDEDNKDLVTATNFFSIKTGRYYIVPDVPKTGPETKPAPKDNTNVKIEYYEKKIITFNERFAYSIQHGDKYEDGATIKNEYLGDKGYLCLEKSYDKNNDKTVNVVFGGLSQMEAKGKLCHFYFKNMSGSVDFLSGALKKKVLNAMKVSQEQENLANADLDDGDTEELEEKKKLQEEYQKLLDEIKANKTKTTS